MGNISDKLLQIGIALDVDMNASASNIEDAIKGVEKKLGGIKFEPESIQIVKLDNKGFEIMARDAQNTLYRLSNTFKKFNKDGSLNISIGTDALNKTNAVLNRYSKTVTTLQDKMEVLKQDPNVSTATYDKWNAKLVAVGTEIDNIKQNEEQLTVATQNRTNKKLADIDREITKERQLSIEKEKSAKYEEQLNQRFGKAQTTTAKVTGDGTDTASIHEVTKAIGLQNSEFKKAEVVFDSAGNAWTKYTHQTSLIDGTVKKLTTTIKQNSTEMRQNASVSQNATVKQTKWIDNLKNKFRELTTYMSASALIFAFFNAFGKGITIIKEVDSSMTELRKVTDETDATYAKFLNTAGTLGTAIGKSIPDVINATSEFSRLGYALDEATALAEKALILTNIGDGISLEDSTASIVSAMKGFELDGTAKEVEANSLRIIDSINAVSNKYAVSVTDISDSISKMSAVMNQTGTSLEETMGMFTAGQEIMQDSSKVSNGLLTIAQRIRGISDEGEDLSNLQPTLEKQFNKMGLSLLSQNGELKSTYQILNDLSTVWGDQSSQYQQYIGELIAGRHSCQNVQKCA